MLWKPLGSEHGCLLPSQVTPVTPAQATIPWVVWVEPIASPWLTAVHCWSAQKVFLGAERGSELSPRAPGPPAAFAGARPGWTHGAAPVLGMSVASRSSAMQAAWSADWQGWRLPAPSTWGWGEEGWAVPRSLLFLAGISMQLGQQMVSTQPLGVASAPGPRGQSHQLLLLGRKPGCDGKVHHKDCQRCHWKNLKGQQTLVFRQLNWCWNIYTPEPQTPLAFLSLLHVSELLRCKVSEQGTRGRLHPAWYSCIMSARALK